MTFAYRRHAPFYWALLTALFAFPVTLLLRPALALEASAVGFFLVYLALVGFRLPYLTGAYLKTHAARNDAPAPVILVITVGVAIIAVVSLFSALNGSQAVAMTEIALAFSSVALGWFTIHTMAALHYAHLYWAPSGTSEPDPDARGLSFPGTPSPGVFDFLYFAFVIGMTAQTSDVTITTTAMRKLNLLHAVVSFLFNTVLVAAAVNTAVSLAQ